MALNRIYKVVWSKTKGCYVVVSELAKRVGRNKAKAIVISSAAMAMAVSPVMTSTVSAELNQAGTGGGNTVAWGEQSNVAQNNGVAIGKQAQSTGDSAIALGFQSNSTSDQSVAIGLQTNASNKQTVAVGSKSQATGDSSIAIGKEAKASSESSVALGSKTQSTNKYTTAVGATASASQEGATALGYKASATAKDTIAIGNSAKAEQEGVLALGSASFAQGKNTIAIGDSATAKKEGDIIIGKDAKSRDQGGGFSVAIGLRATAGNTASNAETDDTTTEIRKDSGSVAIGTNAYTGLNRNNTAVNSSVAIGAGAGVGYRSVRAADGTPLGVGTDPDTNAKVLVKAFGGTTNTLDYFNNAGAASKDGFFSFQGVDINEGVALGRNTRAIGDQSVAIGAQSIAGMGSIVIGGNDIQAYDGKKYFKAADPNSADARSVNDFNAAVTPGTGKKNPTDKTESELTISEKYKELVGAGLDRSYRASYGQDGSTVIGMQAHSTTPLGVAIGTNSIVRKGAFGATAIGSGASVVANAEAAVAIGMGSEAQGNYAVAAGTAARAKEAAVAAGYRSNAETSAVAVGDHAQATKASVAVGQLAQATKEADIAVGQGAKASGNQGAIAVGLGTQAQGDSSIMIGGSEITEVAKQRVSYQKEKVVDGKVVIKTEKKTEMIGGVPTDRTVRSVVMENTSGTIQQAYGELTNGGILNTTTLDYSSAANKNGHGSISMGVHSLSTGDLGTAIGTGARVTKLGGVALGTGAMSELQNGVAIGTGSRADSRSIGTRQTDISYDEEGHIVPFDSKKVAYTFYWAGGSNTSEGDVVSFGSPGAERQLKNVAAGRIADDSTDAINGSQLNSVTKRMSNGWSVEAEKDKTSSGVLKLNGALATKGSEVHSENGKTTTRENPGTATGNVDKIRLNDEVKIRVGDNLVLHQEDASRPVYEDPDHPERQTGTRVTSKFTYSLNPELTGLKSAQFKNDAGDTTDINGAGVTVTPVTAGKQPVSLTTTGLNNGGNAISNVAGNLPSTKNNDATTGASNATTSQAAPALGNAANQVNPTNAATVSDVLNAGWNLQGNNKAVDFVKPYDTVNFVNGDGTTATVESADGKTSTVKYSVNLGDGLKKDDATNKITVSAADKSLTVGTDGVKVNPGDKSLKTTNTGLTVNTADKSLEVTNDGLKVKTDGTTITTDDTNGLKVVTGAIEPVKTGADSGTVKVKDGDKGKIATVDSVVNAVNSAAFTLKASANGGTRNAGSGVTTDGESIKAGSTIEMIAGKNLDVKHDASGKITFATVDTPSFTTVQVGGDQGPKLSKTNDGDLKVSGSNGTDPVKVTNVKSGLDTYGGNVAGTTNKNTGLVDLSKPTGGEPKVSDNTAATVGDIRNMGWIVSSNKTTGADGAVTDTEYSSTVKNANEVRFVGTGSAIVSGKTDGDVRTITVKVDDQTSSNNAVTPVVYTDNDGNRVYPTGETDKDGNQIFNTKPDGKGKAVTGPVKTTVNGPKGTSAPTTLSNVEGNLVGAKTGTNAPTTSATAPTLGTGTDQVNKNNAATVGDVLNAGWNLQNNDAAKDFVKPYDTVNFVNGEGTTAVVETTTDQATSKIKYNVNTGKGLEKTTDNKITVKPGDKSLEVTDDGLKVKTDNKTITTGKDGLAVNTGTVNTVEQGDKKGTVEVPTADAGKIATVDTVAKAVNNAAFTLKASANGGTRNAGSGIGETGELIKAGSTIEMIAGKNLDVKHDASGKITFATVESPSFNTIQVGGDQGPKLSKTDDGNIKVSDKDGTNPVNITNVKSNLPDTQNSDTTNTATNPSNATTSKVAPNTTNKTGDSYINPNNAATVSDVLNAGWNLQGNGTAVDFVKPYDTVNFVNGVNTTAVVSTVDGKTSNVTYNVTGLPITYTDKDGNLVSKIGDEFYKVNDKGQPLDAKGNPSTKVNKDGKPVDDAGNVIDPINTTNNPVKTSLVNPAPEANKTGTTSPTTLDNVTSKLENYKADPVNGKDPAKNNLRDLTNKNVTDNTVATVGDIRNMGWIVSSDKTTGANGEYSEAVKNANEVRFVGEGSAIVSGKTEGNVRTITVKVDNQTGINKTVTPVNYTKADGTKVYPQEVDNGDGTKTVKFFENPDGTGKEIPSTEVITSVNGPKGTTTPATLSNIKSNLPDTKNSDTTNTATDPSNATTSKVAPNTTNKTGDSYINPNNAATVSDVLNAGWNLQGNGTAVDFVKPYDTVNFVNGLNTTAVVSTVDGKTSNVTYNVTGLPVTYTTADGTPVTKIGDKYYKVNDQGQPVDGNGAPVTKFNKDGKPVDANGQEVPDVNITDKPLKTSLVNPTPENNKTGTTSPTSLSNVKNNIPNVNDGSKTITNPDGTEKQGDIANINKAPLTAEEAAALANPKTKDGQTNPKYIGNNAATVSDVLNAGWNLQNNGAAKDFVKPYDTVNFVNGGNTTAVVTTNAEGTASDVTFNVTGLPITNTITDNGKEVPVVKVGDTFYPAKPDGTPDIQKGQDGNPTNGYVQANDGKVYPRDAVTITKNQDGTTTVTLNTDATPKTVNTNLVNPNVANTTDKPGNNVNTPNQLGNVANGAKTFDSVAADGTMANDAKPAVKLANDGKWYPADKVEANGKPKDGATPVANPLAPKNAAGDVLEKGNDGKWYKANELTNGIPNPTATAQTPEARPANSEKSGLINFTESNPNNAATIGDLQNMGWVVSAEGNSYSDQVRNANEVKFVGEGTATVTGKTDDKGIRTITVKVDDQTSTNNAVTPVVYTDKDGKQVYPTGKTDKDGNQIFNTQPDGKGNTVTGPVKTTVNGSKGTNSPTSLSNVKNNIPAVNDENKTITDADGKAKPDAGNVENINKAPLTAEEAADLLKPTTKDGKANPNFVGNNAATVSDVLNAGWNLQNNGTAKDFVKPYDTVNFVNGGNTTAVVTTNAEGTVSDVTFNVTGLPVTYTTEDGAPVSKVGDKYYKVNDKGQPISDAGKPAVGTNNDGKLVDENNNVIEPIDTTKPLKTALVNPTPAGDKPNTTTATQLGNVTSGLDKYGDQVNNADVPGTTDKNRGLVDLSKPANADPKVSDNTAATVGDLRNMGWIVSSNKTTGENGAVTTDEYSATVKNANEVKFVGEGTAVVSGKTDDKGVRTITVKVDDQTSTNNAVTPVVYTDKDGKQVYPTGKTDKDGNQIFNTKPDGKGEDVTGPVKTTINGPKGTTSPTSLSNVKNNIPNVNDGSKTITNPDGTEKQGDIANINKAPLTAEEAAALANPKTKDGQTNPKYIGNNAATVSDVLNAGWNLQNNGTAKDFVKPYDTVNFINGLNTTAVVTTSDDGTTSNVTYNVTGLPVTYTTADGTPVTKIGDKYYKVNDQGQPVDGTGAPVTKFNKDGKPVDANGQEVPDVNITDKPLKTSLVNPAPENNKTGTTSPTSLSNVKNNIPTVNDEDKTAHKVDGTAIGGKNNTEAPITAGDAANLLKPTVNGAANPNFVGNNAATVSDVLNAGWNLQNNGTAKDFVKPYDTVNFVNGGNTTAVVTTNAEGTASDVTFNVTGLPITNTITDNGKEVPVVKVGDTFYPAKPDGTPDIQKGQDGNPTNGYVQANDGKVYPRDAVTITKNQDGTTTVTPNTDATPKTVNTNLVNPNVANTTDKPGNNVNTPNQLGNVANGAKTFDSVAADGTMANDAKPAVKLANDGKWYPADKVEANGKPKDGATPVANPLAPKNAAGDVLEKGNDGKWYKANELTNGIPNPTATAQTPEARPANSEKSGLINFTESNPNNAATIGDLQNMGWVVSAEGNSYSDQVRNANEVKFVGEGTATVTGKTDDKGIRTITVKVDDQTSTNNAVTPVVYTDKDGNQVYPTGKKDPDGNQIFNTQPDGKGNTVTGPVKTTVNGPKGTNSPTSLSNVKNNIPAVNDENKTITDADGKVKPDAGNVENINKAPLTAEEAADLLKPTTKDGKPNPNFVGNNAATVSDVLSAGWNLQGNGTNVDFVKPYDTVNFRNGGNTTVSVTTDDNLTSHVQVNVTGLPVSNTITDPTTGKQVPVVKVGDSFYTANPDGTPKIERGQDGNPTNGYVRANDGKLYPRENVTVTPPTDANGTPTITPNAGATPTTVNTNLVNPNVDNTTNEPGNNVSTPNQLGNVANGAKTFNAMDADGKDYVKANNGKYYEPSKVNADGSLKEGTNATADAKNPLVLANDGKWYPADKVSDKGTPEAGATAVENPLAPKNAAGEPLVQAKDGKWYKPSDLQPNGTPTPTAKPQDNAINNKAGLVDFSNSNPNNAATIGDLQNMGWVISAQGNSYSDQVRNTNEVKFVGEGTAIVTGKTDDKGVRTITVKVDDQVSTNNSVTPVVYTDKDGKTVYPIKDDKGNVTYHTTPDGKGPDDKVISNGDVNTSINGPKDDQGNTRPASLSNVKNNIPAVNDENKTITDADGKVKPDAGNVENINKAPLTAEEAADLLKPTTKDGKANPNFVGNNAATVSDVLNAGWNLQNNGAAKDFVKPFDTVNFVNGGNTTAVVTTNAEGTASDVTFNVTGLPIATTIATPNGPVQLTKVGDNYYPVNADGTPNIQKDGDNNPTNGYVKADNGKYYPAGDVTFGKDPVTNATTVTPKDGKQPVTFGNSLTNPNVVNTENEPNKAVAAPTTLNNVKNNIPTVDDKKKQAFNPDGTEVTEPNTTTNTGNAKAPITATDAQDLNTPYKVDDKGNYLDVNGNITTDPAQRVANPKYIGNNAATVSDVLSAGWNLQGNGTNVDFVKPYDTVNFRNGGNTTVSVTTDDNLTSHVQVNVTGLPVSNTITDPTTGKQVPVVKVGDSFYPVNPDGTPKIERGQDGNPTNGYVRANDGKLYPRESVTTTPNQDGSTTVTPNTDAKPITVNTNLANPNVDNTTDNPGNNVNTPSQLGNVANGAKTFDPVAADGTKLVQVGDKFYPADKVVNGVLKPDATEADAKDPVKLANDGKWYPADKVEANGKPKDSATAVENPLAPKNAAGEPLVQAKDGKWYKPADLQPNGRPTPTAQPQDNAINNKAGLVDFSNSNPNNAATIGDLQNMGWVVSAQGNSYSDQVRNANEVKFVGEGTAIVTGKTDDKGVRTITVKVDDQVTTNNSVTPVVYTDKNGNTVYPIKDDKGNVTYHTTPDGKGENDKVVPNGDVNTSINGPKDDQGNTRPASLSNVKNNIPAVSDADKKVTNPDGTDRPNAGDVANINKAPLTAEEAADLLKPTTKDGKPNANFVGNNAATVSDVLNAGWNLQNNGAAKDFVKPYDTVNFVNGLNTTAVVTTSEDGTTSNVTYNVTGLPVTYTTADGTPVTKIGDKYYKVNDQGQPVDGTGAPVTKFDKDGKPLDANGQEVPDVNITNNPLKTSLVNPTPENNKTGTTSPTSLSNVKNNIPAVNDTDKKVTNPDGTDRPNAGDVANINKAPLTAKEAADLLKPIKDGVANPNFAGNNAATVSDVLNAGWNLQGNGTNVDFVKPYDTVNFRNGGNTTVSVTTDDNLTSHVQVNVTGLPVSNTIIDPTTGKQVPVVKVGDAFYRTNPDGTPNIERDKAGNPTNGYVRANDGKLYPRDAVEVTPNATDPKQPPTITPKAGATPTTVNTNLVNPNVDNTTDNPGNNVNTPNQLGNVANGANTFNAVDAGGKDYVKANNGKYYEPSKVNADGSLKEGTNATADAKNPLVLANDGKWYPADKVSDKGTPEAGAKSVENPLAPKNAAGQPLVQAKDGKWYIPTDVQPNGLPTPTAQPQDNAINNKAGLVNFANSNPNNAATVGDLQNMGWVVSAPGNSYSEQVRNANEVKFVGEGTAIVTGKTDDKGVRTITVKVDDQVSTNNAIMPTNFTTADGTKVYPVKDDAGNVTYHTTPDGKGTGDMTIDPKNVVTSVNGPKGTTTPTTLKNVKNNIPNVNDGSKTVTTPDGKEKVGDVENINTAPLTAEEAAKLSNPKTADGAANPNYIGNNAATVSDVLSAGWNLQNNGESRDFVKPYDTVNFINGLGTTAVVTTREGNTTSDVTFNVKPANSSVTVDEDGVKVTTGEITSNPNGSVAGSTTPDNAKTLKDALDAAVKELATAKDALKTAETALAANPKDPALQKTVEDKKAEVAAKQTPVNEAQKAHDDAGLNKIATVQNVADAINNSGFNLKTSADGGEKLTGTKDDGELIKPSNTVEMVAGKNLTVKQDANGKITYATKDDVTFTNVDTGTLNVGNPNTYTDGKGNTYTKVGDKYYKPADVVNGTPKENATPVTIPADVVVKPVSPVTMKTEAAKPATNNATDAQPSSALNITSKDGKPTQITGVGSTLNINKVETTPEGTTPKPGAAPDTKPKTEDAHLVDLNGTADAPVNKNAAATVGDLQNMGWVVSAKDGNGYKDVVKNANVVDFKGGNGIEITGNTLADGTREITVGIKEGEVTNKVTITHGDGTKTDAVKIGDNYYKVDKDGKPVGFDKDENGKPAGTPLKVDPKTDKVTNAGAGFVTGNTVANAIQDSGWNVGIGSTDKDFSKAEKVYDKVNPSDDVKFTNGANTNVSMVTVDALNEDGTKKATTFVKVDVNRDLKIDSVTTGGTATDKNGNNLVKVGDKYYKEGDVTVVTNPDGTTTVTPKENAKAVPPADVIPAKDGAMIVKNADGKDVVSATVGKDGNGAFGINGKDGKNGISMTAKDGQGTIGVNGKDGKSTTIAGDTITIKDKDNNATNIGVNTITLVDKAGNTTTTTADKSEIKDAAGNINTNTATGNTLKDPNGNTHTSTASTSELKDKDGNTNTSTPTTNVLKDTNGNTNTSAAAGTTYKDKDENKTVVGPKEINISDKSGENTASLTNKDLLLNAKDPNTGVDKTSHVSGDKIAFSTTDEMEKVVDKEGKPVIDPATGKQKEVVKMEKVFDKDGKPVIDPVTGKQKEVVKNPGNSTEYTNEGLRVVPNSTVARDVNGNPTFLDKDGKPVMKDIDGKYKYVGQDGKPGEKYTDAVGSLKPNVVDNTRVISFGMDKPVLDKNGKPVTDPDGNPVMTEGISAGMQQMHNLAPGTKDTDAVNVSQLRGTTININNRMNRMGAQAAALAGLQSIQYDPLEPTQISAGLGYYKGASALALGINHYKNESTMFHMGASLNGRGDETMMNASVTWKFGARADETAVKDTFRQGPISSAYTLQDKVSALEAQNKIQKDQLNELRATNAAQKAENEAQREELALMKAQIAELFKRMNG